MKKAMSKGQALAMRFGVGVVGALGSVAAFAQTSGTTTTAVLDDTPIVTAINAIGPDIVDIGGAVLAVVVVAWGYRTVKGFIGR